MADELANRAAKDRGRVALTERDWIVLAFIAEHRVVERAHVRALLAVGDSAAGARLRALAGGGFIARRRSPDGHDECVSIRTRGLAALGNTLPPTRLDYRGYDHDVGVAWVCLAARAGLWGPARDVICERRMRSHDRSDDGRLEPFAVRLGGVGPAGSPRLHYPDLLLVLSDGKRVAFELELSGKSRVRRERILAGYAADPRIDAVVYLVDKTAVARGIQASARKLGISDQIHVQRVARRATSVPEDGLDRAGSRSRGSRGAAAIPGGGGPRSRDRGDVASARGAAGARSRGGTDAVDASR